MSDIDNIQLKPGQQQVLRQIQSFVDDKDHKVFILKGYAGTGKTTLMRFLIKHLSEEKKNYILLASTGRAAKILCNLTNNSAQTIHSLIYSFESLNVDLSDMTEEPDGQLYLTFKAVSIDSIITSSCIYIVDESSMISDIEDKNIIQAKFGTGKLLTELLKYDNRVDSKFIFIGDPCQLPPIRGTYSPALSKEYIESEFNLNTEEAQLSEIIRQGVNNSIIQASQTIRGYWKNAPSSKKYYLPGMKVWGKLPFKNRKEIVLYRNSGELLNQYFEIIKSKKYNDATYISSYNTSCLVKSQLIRRMLDFNPDFVHAGDLLMVIQNNYISGLMNGDMVEVVETFDYTETIAGLIFRKIVIKELFTQRIYSLLLIENLLYQKTLNLTADQQKNLFWNFNKRMKEKGITQKKNKAYYNDMMLHDPYLNALRCSFGYVITCHKAQGGEWNDVFLDIPRNITLNPTKEMYQWIYTAMTRAKERLHLVNDFYLE